MAGVTQQYSNVFCRMEHCRTDITSEIHIACAVCENFHMCLHCFSVGDEQDGHLNTHSYRVVDNLRFELFEKGWGVDEEVKLMTQIEKFGIGNWIEIAKALPGKKPEAVERHYLQHYLQSKSTIDTQHGTRSKIGKLAVEPSKYSQQSKPNNSNNGKVSPPTLGYNFAGYYPKRHDFEQEYNDSCESMIAGIVFYDDDTPLDTKLKTTMLRIYNRRLSERQRRKDFCLKYDFLNDHEWGSELKQSRDFRQQYDMLRTFVRFQAPEEFKKLSQALFEKHKLTKNIGALQECRRMGLTSSKEAKEYFAAKRRHSSRDSSRRPSAQAGKQPGLSKGSSVPANTATSRKAGAAAGSTKKISIETLPDASILSPPEQELCRTIALFPSQLVWMKSAFVLFDQRGNGLRWDQAKQLSPHHDVQTAKVYLFMHDYGWIDAVDAQLVKTLFPILEAK